MKKEKPAHACQRLVSLTADEISELTRRSSQKRVVEKRERHVKDDVSALKQLGSQKTTYEYRHPCKEMLETFPFLWAGGKAFTEVAISFPEFTSLCPKTGQPDFAEIVIKYTPRKVCVESKSLKLYFFAWRTEGTFMETIVNRICEDLVAVLDPEEIEVTGKFNPRGGLRLEPTAYWSHE
jgi:7-cyano-7-deazaguanine reductase